MLFLEKNEQIGSGAISSSKKRISGDYEEHIHGFFEIEYIVRGHGTYFIDGQSYDISENTLFFMSPVNYHGIRNCDAEIINIMFSYSICDSMPLFSLFTDTNNVITFTDDENRLVKMLLDEIVKGGSSDYSVSFLQALLYKLSEKKDTNKRYPASHIRSAIIYIAENFRKNITLGSTAEKVNLSPSYLSDLFVRETGRNFKEYLDDIRFDYSLKLLEYTNISATEIPEKSGFNDYANFTRRFKNRFGLTPTQYRIVIKYAPGVP